MNLFSYMPLQNCNNTGVLLISVLIRQWFTTQITSAKPNQHAELSEDGCSHATKRSPLQTLDI